MNIINQYLSDMKEAIDKIPSDTLEQVIQTLHNARLNGNQVFIMGNGGSAATASHFVCDLAKNTRCHTWPNFRVIGLTDNVAILTAYSNDEGYENALAGQLSNLIRRGDIVIGISCSGNSPNVINAVELAKRSGAKTIGFTGKLGGKLAEMVDINISAIADAIQQQEDIHSMLCHMVTVALNGIPAPVEVLTRPVYTEYNTLSLVEKLFGRTVVFTDESEAGKRAASLDLIHKISEEIAAHLDLHELLSSVLLMTLESIGASSGSIMVLNEEGDVIDGMLAYAGKINTGSLDRLSEIRKMGLAGWVAEHRQAALIENTHNDPRWLKKEYEVNTDGNRSALSVPLMTQDRVVGVVTLVHPQAGWFTLEDLALLTAITITMSYSFNKRQSSPAE